EEILASFNENNRKETEQEAEDFSAPSLARTEWEHINRVLADCGGNISKTAKKLGIHRRTLQRKLYKYPPRT
ncbi:MAG: response regulator transcription factor, partial [Desulfurivibrionaceae bacterium]